jgi:hypothetical protein
MQKELLTSLLKKFKQVEKQTPSVSSQTVPSHDLTHFSGAVNSLK